MDKELNKKRRIPLEKKFMCKKINDILYGYLQSIATFNPNTNTLYIKKDDINFSELERIFNGKFKRLTLKRNFDYLMACGFIGEDVIKNTYGDDMEVYILTYNKKELYKIIPIDTLRFLVNTATPSVIATYVYLLSKWEWKGKNYIFTSEELIRNCLGMKSTTNNRDYEKINDILDCLYNNGLIDYEDIYIKKNNKVIAKKQLIKVSKTYNSKRK